MCRYNPVGRVQPAAFSRRVVSGESHVDLPRRPAPADQPLGDLTVAAVAGNRTFRASDGEPLILERNAYKITHFIGRLFRLYWYLCRCEREGGQWPVYGLVALQRGSYQLGSLRLSVTK